MSKKKSYKSQIVAVDINFKMIIKKKVLLVVIKKKTNVFKDKLLNDVY